MLLLFLKESKNQPRHLHCFDWVFVTFLGHRLKSPKGFSTALQAEGQHEGNSHHNTVPIMTFERPSRFTNVTVALMVLVIASSSLIAESFVARSLRSNGFSVLSNEIGRICDGTFSKFSARNRRRISSPFVCQAKSSPDGSEEDDDEVMLQDEDWRAFRAKLVMGEQKPKMDEDSPSPSSTASTSVGSDTWSNVNTKTTSDDSIIVDDGDLDGIGALFRDDFAEEKSKAASGKGDIGIAGMTPLDPSQWAYDSGDVIEKGAIILGGVEQEFGFGLRQQYFHKAAILVLDHSDTFTKGIILNRPTDLTLEDDINAGVQWRVWFGGDVEGLHASHPDIACLHSLKNEKATKASIPVMKDIQWTTFENAKVGVHVGKPLIQGDLNIISKLAIS